MPSPAARRLSRPTSPRPIQPSRLPRAEGSHLTDHDWITAARQVLIKEGPDAVKIDRLAKSCGVSRGGFYWRFKNRKMLLDRLLEDWIESNQLIVANLQSFSGTPDQKIYFAASIWQCESRQAEYDLAVRNWARSSAAAAVATAAVDAQYLTIIEQAFIDAGHSPADARFRAYILYNHYLGVCTSISIGKGSTLDTNWELARFLLG